MTLEIPPNAGSLTTLLQCSPLRKMEDSEGARILGWALSDGIV